MKARDLLMFMAGFGAGLLAASLRLLADRAELMRAVEEALAEEEEDE